MNLEFEPGWRRWSETVPTSCDEPQVPISHWLWQPAVGRLPSLPFAVGIRCWLQVSQTNLENVTTSTQLCTWMGPTAKCNFVSDGVVGKGSLESQVHLNYAVIFFRFADIASMFFMVSI